MPKPPPPRRRRALFAAFLAAMAPLTLGFDLDRGELACERAASHLFECCPSLVLPRWVCIQQGGCERDGDGTIVALDESDCLREASCEELASRDVCARLEARVLAVEDIDGPTIQALYQEDWLCD